MKVQTKSESERAAAEEINKAVDDSTDGSDEYAERLEQQHDNWMSLQESIHTDPNAF